MRSLRANDFVNADAYMIYKFEHNRYMELQILYGNKEYDSHCRKTKEKWQFLLDKIWFPICVFNLILWILSTFD